MYTLEGSLSNENRFRISVSNFGFDAQHEANRWNERVCSRRLDIGWRVFLIAIGYKLVYVQSQSSRVVVGFIDAG